jgi:hypothetical protein
MTGLRGRWCAQTISRNGRNAWGQIFTFKATACGSAPAARPGPVCRKDPSQLFRPVEIILRGKSATMQQDFRLARGHASNTKDCLSGGENAVGRTWGVLATTAIGSTAGIPGNRTGRLVPRTSPHSSSAASSLTGAKGTSVILVLNLFNCIGAVPVNTPTLQRWQWVQTTTVSKACATGVYAMLFS